MSSDGRMHRARLTGRAISRAAAPVALALVVAGCGPLAAAGASSAARSPAESRGIVTGPFPGTWFTEIDRDDLTAAGFTDPGLLDENSGRFTTTYNADGTWDQVQESLTGAAVVNPVWKGTWTVAGDVLTQETTFPEQYAGDVVRFVFTHEGDSLRLRIQDPPDPILPVITDTHPWKRGVP